MTLNHTITVTFTLAPAVLQRIDTLVALLTHGMTEPEVAALTARLKASQESLAAAVAANQSP